MENKFLGPSSLEEAPGTPARARSDGGPLPFDPARITTALARRWRQTAMCACAVGLVACVGSYSYFKSAHVASGQLLREETAGPNHNSDTGGGYTPSQLSTADLQSLMQSPTVMERTTARTKVHGLGKRLTITPEHGTDIIDISYRSPVSDDDALKVLNVYGKEVLRLTRDLASGEASETSQLLRGQLDTVLKDLAKVDKEMQAFCKESGTVNLDKELDAYMREKSEQDARAQQAEMDFETVDLRIGVLAKELMSLNGVNEQLRAAKERLASLEATFADGHPDVIEQKQQIADLQSKVDAINRGEMQAPRPSEAGAASGLYQEWVSAQAQNQVLGAQVKKFRTMQADLNAKLHGLSENTLKYADIISRHQALQATQVTLENRQREAELIAENGSSSYVFIPGQAGTLSGLGLALKVGIFAVLGLVLGTMGGASLAAFIELTDNKARTSVEVQQALKMPLLGALSHGEEESRYAVFRIWTAIRTHTEEDKSPCIGVVSTHPREGRSTLIKLLVDAAAMRTQKIIAVTNNPPAVEASVVDAATALVNPLTAAKDAPAWVSLPEDWVWTLERRTQWMQAAQEWSRSGYTVFLELPSAQEPEATILAEGCTALVWVVESGRSSRTELAEATQTFTTGKCRLAGSVLNRTPKLCDPLGRLAS